MIDLLAKLLGRAGDLLGTEPTVVLFLSASLIAVFLSTVLMWRRDGATQVSSSVAWTIYKQFTQIIWAVVLVAILLSAVVVLRSYLNRTMAEFRRTHGRVSETNLQAVRTIWGDEQEQHELVASLWYEEEETERLQSEDPTRPAVLRKKMVRHNLTGNPFVTTRHEVTIKQNPRKKGSAVYPGYETECRFKYRLKNYADRDVKATLRFPLPSSSAMYDDLAVSLNGKSIRDQLEIKDSGLVVELDVPKSTALDFEVGFKSRGLSHWYFQVSEPREIRDFTLTLRLPDLSKDKLNYPEGCMSPSELAKTPDGRGSVLTYHLDRAISNKGMGIELPKQSQPGELASAVLSESTNAWLLLFAAVVLGLTLSGAKHSALVSVMVGAAAAFGYGLLGNLSDSFLGMWGSLALILIPLFLLLGWLQTRLIAGMEGKLVALEIVVFGLIYPCLAGLDDERQMLYLNVAGFVFLAIAAWQLLRRLGGSPETAMPVVAPATP